MYYFLVLYKTIVHIILFAFNVHFAYNKNGNGDLDMANVNVTIRMDENLRKEAAELFDDLGMGLNQAITIFVKQAVREQKMPFIIRKNIPNQETLESFKEAENIKANPKSYKAYDDVDEMFEEILK